eukprot:240321_1
MSLRTSNYKSKSQFSTLLSAVQDTSINSNSDVSLHPVSTNPSVQDVQNRDDYMRDINKSLSKRLRWVMYANCMRITSKPNHRNTIFNAITICISICSLIGYVYPIVTTFDRIPKVIRTKPETTIYKVNWILMGIQLALCKCLSIYYFIRKYIPSMHHFKFKHSDLSHPSLSPMLKQYCYSHIKVFNRRLLCYIIIATMFYVGFVSSFFWPSNDGKHLIIKSIVLWSIFITGSIFFFQTAWSVTAFKVQCKLYYLQCLMKSSDHTPNFEQILGKYKSLYHEFKQEHKFWNFYMILYACCYGLLLWQQTDLIIDTLLATQKALKHTSYFFGLHSKFEIIASMMLILLAFLSPLIEYIISSSHVNNEYNKFLDMMHKYEDNANGLNNYQQSDQIVVDMSWNNYSNLGHSISQSVRESYFQTQSIRESLLNKYGSIQKRKCMDNKGIIDIDELCNIVYNANHFHLLSNYVSRFSIKVKLFGVELTPYQIIRFVVVFLLLKYLAFMATVLTASIAFTQPPSMSPSTAPTQPPLPFSLQ